MAGHRSLDDIAIRWGGSSLSDVSLKFPELTVDFRMRKSCLSLVVEALVKFNTTDKVDGIAVRCEAGCRAQAEANAEHPQPEAWLLGLDVVAVGVVGILRVVTLSDGRRCCPPPACVVSSDSTSGAATSAAG